MEFRRRDVSCKEVKQKNRKGTKYPTPWRAIGGGIRRESKRTMGLSGLSRKESRFRERGMERTTHPRKVVRQWELEQDRTVEDFQTHLRTRKKKNVVLSHPSKDGQSPGAWRNLKRRAEEKINIIGLSPGGRRAEGILHIDSSNNNRRNKKE